ncbi:MAG: cytochrome C oxidase subunit IV family protein [Raineya sp.]|jgi:cytochrome c oxidase subunit IV|nr:cytochrome C oxidase subunit IV family protein [Raineya sp.]
MAHTYDNVANGEIPKPQTKVIWVTFWILFAITAVEFLLAFTVPAGAFRTSIFIILTLVKAFYIVAEFMHLKHEVKGLIYAIIVPTVFVIWLIGAMFIEGGYIYEILNK